MLGAEWVVFDCHRLLRPSGPPGAAAVGDQILQWGILELLHQFLCRGCM